MEFSKNLSKKLKILALDKEGNIEMFEGKNKKDYWCDVASREKKIIRD